MKQKSFLFGILITFFLFSCLTKQKATTKKSKSDVVPIKYIEILNVNDTIEKKEEKGILKFFFKLNDTIQLNTSDKLKVNFLLTIISSDKAINNSLRKAVEKELIVHPLKLSDTLEIPFTINPHFKGKGTFIGLINDRYFLNSYTGNNEVRMLSYENFIEKDVFIK